MKLEGVEALARERGLKLEGVEEVGPVLVLRPDIDEELPALEVLRELASELEGAGFRYVTLELDGFGEGELHG